MPSDSRATTPQAPVPWIPQDRVQVQLRLSEQRAGRLVRASETLGITRKDILIEAVTQWMTRNGDTGGTP